LDREKKERKMYKLIVHNLCYSLAVDCPPKALAWYAAWHYGEMVELLRDGASWEIFRSLRVYP
jgi:hypothetical protein